MSVFEHSMCNLLYMPVREVLSVKHYITDLTLGLGEVVFD